MKKTHHTTEQIIRILREAETSGQSHEDAIAAERESLPGGGVGEINAREAGVGSHIVHWRRPRRAGKGQGVASGRSQRPQPRSRSHRSSSPPWPNSRQHRGRPKWLCRRKPVAP